jgi:hypothetical protein
MDILAHTLWTNAGARGANALAKKKNKKVHANVGWAAFWGVFPDFFAFTIPFVLIIFKIVTGQVSPASFGEHHVPVAGFDLAHYLYQYSHSLVIWAIVFLIVWAIAKRPRYELFGWALHILIDIPSHTLSFFPTPFLFPISNYHFPYGLQWSNRWYMLINYSALVIIWSVILYKKYHKKSVPQV